MNKLTQAVLEHQPDCASFLHHCLGGCREVYFLLAALCLLVGATTTHGLGGSLRHKQTGPFTMELGSDVDTRQPDPATTWRFYQPFR